MELFVNNLAGYLNTSIFYAFLASFAGGLLTSFTPCVYPLIPITSSFVTAQNIDKGSRSKAFLLSLFYVIGVSLVYAFLGVFAAMTGQFFGELSTHPVSQLIVGNIMILLGLSMLDVFFLQAPAFLRNSENRKVRGFGGALLVGMVSGLVVAPCTAPPLGVLLAFVATTKSAVLGGSLLFVFAFGMGALLLLVGTFSGFLGVLPKSGAWMVKIKKAIGFSMILVGEYFIFKAGELWF